MLMLPQLLLPPPLLSTKLATMSTTRSTMFPRSLSRSMFPPTPPATSSTTPQLSELPSPTTVLLPPPLLPVLPVLLLFNYLQESRTQAGQQDFHLESDLTNIMMMSLQISNFHSIFRFIVFCCEYIHQFK